MFYLGSILFILFGWVSCRGYLSFYFYQGFKLSLGLGYAFLVSYFGLVDQTGLSFISYFAWAIAIAWVIDFFILKMISDDDYKNYFQLVGSFVIGSFVLYMYIFYPFYIAEDKYKVVQGKEITQLQQETDEKNIPSVPLPYAKYKAEKLFGEIENNAFYALGNYTIQKINDELFWVVSVEHSDYSTFGKSGKVTPGYIKINALNENASAEFVKMEMRYVPSAYFGDNLKRMVRKSFPEAIILESSFEPDNEGNPFYAVTIAKYDKFRFIPKVSGIVLFDPITGEMEFFGNKEIPSFVDQLIPADDIASKHNSWYGKYAKGWLNSWWGKQGIKVPTAWGEGDEVVPVYDSKGNMNWFTDFTSPTGGASMVGYSLINAKTGEFTYYTGDSVKGLLNGQAALSAVDKSYIKDQFTGTSPMLYNIYGEMTWFVSVVDADGLLRGYALVNGSDATIMSTAPTKKETFARYKTALVTKKSEGNVIPGDLIGLIEFEGNIDSKEVVSIEKEVFIFFTIEGHDKLFKVSMSKLPLTMRLQINEKVKFSTFETEEIITDVQTFENLTQ